MERLVLVLLVLFLSVAANGVVGSLDQNQNSEDCAACMKGQCRGYNGLYTRSDLPTGYSLVAEIPQGACRISIQQLKHTKNVIALRNTNGSFILNGDWKFSGSRSVEAAGTRFAYQKPDAASLETITAPGPLTTPVDIMIVYYQPNQGIKYSFFLPVIEQPPEQIAPPYVKKPALASDSAFLDPRRLDPPPSVHNQRDEPPRSPDVRPGHVVHRRQRRRKFVWKITGVTACSKSCGGGLQTTVVTCIREYTQTPVLERRCANIEKPTPHPIKCNVQDCPSHWGGYWGSCSGSCGQGVQKYVLQCEQESNGRTIVVDESSCPKPRPQETSRACSLSPCEDTIDNELHQRPDVSSSSPSKTGSVKEWNVGPWSQCSVSCGTGYRSRSVTCPSGQCHAENRPTHAEYCEAGACSSSPGKVSPWLLSEWSQCSETCGAGSQTRLAFCSSKDKCENKPEVSRACSGDHTCAGQWFAGPWGSCSDSCNGAALQKREVLCIIKVRGHSRITNEITCPAHERPPSEQACSGSCPPQWFSGEWGDCACPVGIQRREVRCMDANGYASQACTSDTPISKRTCGCAKKEEEQEKYGPVGDEPVDSSCRDKIRNCHLAVQARLCQYPYYISHCCVSCRKAQAQELL